MKYVVTLNGKNYEVDVTESDAVITSITDVPVAAPAVAPATPPAATTTSTTTQVAIGAGEKVVAPMPGNILSVNVTAGQNVKAGDVMFVLEAMKMENEIVAPCDGTVKQIATAKGAVVNTDDVLAVI